MKNEKLTIWIVKYYNIRLAVLNWIYSKQNKWGYKGLYFSNYFLSDRFFDLNL